MEKSTLPASESEISALVDAFRYFNETAANLNVAYQRLEARVIDLNRELEEKDHQLYKRLRELDRVTRYLSNLVESLSSGVIAIDMEGNITIMNRAAAEMIGMQAESAIGKPYLEVLTSDGKPAGAYLTLLNGPELRSIERKLPGAIDAVTSQTTWVVDSMGERIGVMELFEDVATVRRLEERLEQQKTLTALGEMAASVAHELRNPLAGIGGYAAVLKEELADNAELRDMAAAIVKGVHNLDKIATNLLFLTRRSKLDLSHIEINDIMQDICELLRSEASFTSNKISIELKVPRERINAVADETLLRMILTNLGRNALQSIESVGKVSFKLKWRLLANRFDIVVSDNGCGIPKDNLEKLFNPFFTTRSSGTGLGLSMVKKAVNLHRGEICVESTDGLGTSFTVSLPVLQDLKDSNDQLAI